VMRWRKSIQARQFDGMERSDLGDQQKAFDGLIEGVRELSLRILKPGPEPASTPGDPAAGAGE